ncbi:hypothetical protein [Pontiella sulfatireligans]|uniref:Uncharacterized protein n=1 Tax=Pontiella sulfatireligans TaxID=2750658 RepID=A0A6C2UKA3_9BACT|nr:hypothetical protein [Pontiella sulfatireligans]VGO19744.1 hypothetical protein SCARR_01803 [Pontiella sulfatireligans]
MKRVQCALSIYLLAAFATQAEVFYQDHFDNDSLAVNTNGIGGGAVNKTIEAHSWTDDGNATFVSSGTVDASRALLYSENVFQSDEGFKLTVYYTTDSVGNLESHNFSFGLISSDTDLSSYTNYNPFTVTTDVYSLGVNLTTDNGVGARGLNFTDGSLRTTLDPSGDNVQFVPDSSSWVVLDIGPDGAWQYSINGVTEASGVIAGGFDLSKSYHVVVYGQDDTSKSIQSLKLETYNPLPGLGGRADWLRGAWGALWLPERTYNGNIEGVTIDEFVTQIEDLKTIDYVQLGLASPNIYSPVHMAPHDLIESFWQGDMDDNNDPINLVVPRASAPDPFLSYLNALNDAGLKVEVYVNSYNLLARIPDSIPDDYPDVSARWTAWCDTNTTAQAFINSQPYHTDEVHSNRPYMFCYAEFVLKEYAVRYGDLIDAWCFDSADNIMEACGDDPESGALDDQRIYEAFANACHAGNPKAAIAFNNSVGDRVDNPFSTATLFDDYTFGHPFGGAGDMVENETLYTYNYHVVEWMRDYAGYAFRDDGRTWNDKVVGHFFPKQSTTSWNAGKTGCLTDEEFVEWNSVGLIDGGAITWGTPLIIVNLENPGYNLTLQPYALAQLELTDAHLSTNQFPLAPNWRRADTPLPDATSGQSYTHELTDGFDFWDPAGGSITDLLLTNHPSWLTAEESSPGSGVWVLSGVPTEPDSIGYSFELQAMNGSKGASRTVELVVNEIQPVQIPAAATTNYGTDAVAPMVSAVQSYGAATFQIAFDVVPMSGTSIRSGDGGGSTTGNSWGVYSPGELGNHMMIFKGDADESVEGIANLRVTNFNASGSSLTLENITDLSFKSVTIADSQSPNDRVVVVANGVTNNPGGTKQATNPFVFDLETLAGSASVSNFSLAVGNASTTDKWSVNSIEVSYIVVPASSYSTWASDYGLTGDNALSTADTENGGIGDGYDNLAEYALGMNPTNSDAGSNEFVGTAVDGGTNYFEYVHSRRTDYGAQGLSYLLIDSTNLVNSSSSTNAQDQVLVGPAVDGYEPVTNRYLTDDPVKYIKLEIQKD